MNMVEYGLDPQDAINVPQYQDRNAPTTELEQHFPGVNLEYNITNLTAALEALNHVIQPRGGEINGLSVSQILPNGALFGGFDPRRDRTASGRMLYG